MCLYFVTGVDNSRMTERGIDIDCATEGFFFSLKDAIKALNSEIKTKGALEKNIVRDFVIIEEVNFGTPITFKTILVLKNNQGKYVEIDAPEWIKYVKHWALNGFWQYSYGYTPIDSKLIRLYGYGDYKYFNHKITNIKLKGDGFMYKSDYEEGPPDCEREAPQWYGFTISDAIERAIDERPQHIELNIKRGNMERIIGKMSSGVYESPIDFHCEKKDDKYLSRYIFVFGMENTNYNIVFEALVTTTKEPPKELANYKPFNHFWTKEGEQRQKKLDAAGEAYCRMQLKMEEYEKERQIRNMERLNSTPEIKALNERMIYNKISGIYKIHPENAIEDSHEYDKAVKEAKIKYNIG